ncbi:kinase-like domain-containing protein [Apodospora peruviana]|uniref:non-specific serine/threonine protein kinase n=1 Tax=Apodospora peruviana TaxID=516989 RepID=A0AAE0IRE3_9PEZI|nr:kinase-like domain-containing protein [Apodospora peruviana]
MSHLSVWNPDYSSTKQKAVEDAKKMNASVQDECVKSGKDMPPYQLQELIGKGSFGRVYKASDPRSKAVVAVKIIDIEESDTLNPKLADTYSEFMKEISALKLLSDSGAKNINYVLDVLPVGQSMWMVTEYCAGGSVATLMKPTAPGGLQEKWIIPILREVAEAIYWVHKEGIIHRDIKCANVLVTESGSVQLCDFGVAGIIETKLDKRSTFIGTPHWMAPELFEQSPSYSTPVDIWAFGSLVYEIASGLPPNVMSGFNIPQLGNYIKSHAPRLEGDFYSPQIKHLVAFCLVEDPAKRPTIEQVQQHPYIFNTSDEYPTSTLVNLVRAYKLWESQGGIRKSLFAPGGAQGPADYSMSDFGNDEWNFSTTVDFDQSMADTDARAVYDVYGSNVEFDFSEELSRPAKPKPRRRLPPQLQAVKAPLEKIFDPNTISNYEENARAYYGKAPPPPTSTATSTTDLPLRDNSLHNTLRESLIDLDMSLHDGGHLSQFVDMETIKAGPRISIENEFEEITDFTKPPLSDPEVNINRRTQDWKFPSMAPPASANPEMSHFPFHEERSHTTMPDSGGRPPLMHHPTEPLPFQSQAYDLMPPKPQDNRASVGSLIDLDESLPMPAELTRPSTANSDVASVSGSDIGGANPFDLERHASLYLPVQSSGREPSIYISDDSDLARLGTVSTSTTDELKQPTMPDLPSFPGHSNSISNGGQFHGRTTSTNSANSYDDDGYSTSDYFDSDYLAMSTTRRSRSRSGVRSRSQSDNQGQLPRAAAMPQVMTGAGEMPPVPAPPSARVMQGLASREEVHEDVMRLLASFSEHLGFANARVSALPVRAGRRGGEVESVSAL